MVDSYDLFTELVRCSFLGGNHVINGKQYVLEPTLLKKYDFVRKSLEFGSKTGMNYLFSNLPSDFVSTAKSEVYRKSGGWIEKSHTDKKVKQFSVNQEILLVPILSNKPAVGIDTSSNNDHTFICIAFFDNYKAGYHYLEKFLKIPKTVGQRSEFKFNKLSSDYRKLIDQNFEHILGISCESLLILKTNALIKPEEKIVDIFVKLIQGCFSNYDHKSSERLKLRQRLFKLADETQIHCDADFTPLTPDKIIKQFVKILADENEHTPLHAEKESHESQPIQITDIICGMLKERIMNKKYDFLLPWEFENKLKGEKINRDAKCYLWERKELTD